ncbi:MAG TPA: hypothetical protein PLV68_15635, partial [Ilumatobacteraceae bacterium]|nr:hypothetical protein [Ilumatobacteraceae bacterium]
GTGRDVTVTDVLPAGLTLVSFGGTGWVCDPAATACLLSGELAVGDSAALTLVARVSGAAAAPRAVNRVSVANSTPDPVPSNDEDEDTVDVYWIDLAITKTLVGTLMPEVTATYRLTITN